MLQRGRLRLSQTIDIEDNTQIIQLVVTGKVKRFPDGTFSRFAIANNDIGPKTREIKNLA